jgi:tRNA threonylcarbamoyl adenosine modification protein YeaZ
MPSAAIASGPVLALDTASPVVSVAVADEGGVLASAEDDLRRSSATLLRLVDGVLEAAGTRPRELAGIAVLRGPGSFTGLRVGLATALGFRQALGLPATAPTTLEVLAAAGAGVETWTAPCGAPSYSADPSPSSRFTAAVDALRDEWFVQTWRSGPPPMPEGEPERRRVDELAGLSRITLVGFTVQTLAGRVRSSVRLVEPPPLASTLALLAVAGRWSWDETLLTRPLYLRAPAVHGA